MDVVYTVAAEQALLVSAVAGGGDAIGELERQLDEPHRAEVSPDELERMRRRKVAEENAAAHQKLVGLLQMPRKRELR